MMLPILFLIPLFSILTVIAQENSTHGYLRLHRFERSLTPTFGGLLFKKQTCSSGWGPCLEPEGQCCPLDGVCCTTDGGGCCDAGEYCDVVDGIPGCCDNGKICTLPPSGGGDTSIPVFTSMPEFTISIPVFSSSQNVIPTSSVIIGGGNSGGNSGGIQTTAFGGGVTTTVNVNTNTAGNGNSLPTGLVQSSAVRSLPISNAAMPLLVSLAVSAISATLNAF